VKVSNRAFHFIS